MSNGGFLTFQFDLSHRQLLYIPLYCWIYSLIYYFYQGTSLVSRRGEGQCGALCTIKHNGESRRCEVACSIESLGQDILGLVSGVVSAPVWCRFVCVVKVFGPRWWRAKESWPWGSLEQSASAVAAESEDKAAPNQILRRDLQGCLERSKKETLCNW